MKKIYLCGAMGCYSNPEHYMAWRQNIAEMLGDRANVFNPAAFYNYEENLHKTEHEIMEFEIHNLRESDVIIINLDRVHESVGSIMEISLAKELRIPIIAFGTKDQIHKLHPWLFHSVMRFETDVYQLIKYVNEYFLNT